MTPHKNVYSALSAAQMDMEPLIKGAINSAFKGDGKTKGTAYADLSDVVSVVRGPLSANGLTFFHQIIRGEGFMDMRTSLVHGESETRIDCDVPLIVGKNDMQGMKSATTYAKRIGLESVTGVAPEDDDGNAAVVSKLDDAPRKEAPPYNPAPHIAEIDAAVTGKALLAAINAPGCMNGNVEIAAARVAKLSMLIKGAQTLVAIEAFKNNFSPDWPLVVADATARRAELLNADLEGDKIPDGEDQQ